MPSKDSPRTPNSSDVKLDLYFLIAQFLNDGPCKEAGLTLIRELEHNGLLHRSLDWTGSPRPPDFVHSLSRFRDIPSDYLLRLCERIGPVLDAFFPPPVPSHPSLCGLGRYSVLRDEKQVSSTTWNFRAFSACVGVNPLVPPQNFSKSHNWAYGIFGRENGGSRFKNLLRPIDTLYKQMKLHRRILGHLSSVYCILFDRTGTRIFTGSDDYLIKLWSSSQGRLLATFRGHQSEICDMDVSYENTLLASASCDKEIRIWDTRNGKPITILQSHSAMITSVEFSPLVQENTRYLVTTGRDGNVLFWIWDVQTLQFERQPHKFQERNRPGVAMLCSSCSSGGRFVAVGGSDNLVHIYQIPYEHDGAATIGPLAIAEQDEHTNTVDSIWFSHDGLRLVSGSKDGTARIYTFECSTWTSLVLDVSRTFDSPLDPVVPAPKPNHTSTSKSTASSKAQNKDSIRVIMVSWDFCDENVMTSLTNFTIKVWNSHSRRLISILKGHTDEAYCLEPHPSDKRVLLSAGHDGNVFLWDVISGSTLMSFHNMLEGLGHGAVFDGKFSRDGNSFACTDSHGHLLVFGFGDGRAYQQCPVQQFFHTDYRPLIRDQQGYVLDEQTQQAPHLMPPPFLVDMDGNPYPPELQRLVPGRECSNDSQLLPPIVVQEDNAYEVIDVENIPDEPEPSPPPVPRSTLDDRIQELLHAANNDDSDEAPPVEGPPPFASPSSSVGLRREGDTAGVRQMHRNAPRSQVASVADIMALNQRVITPQFAFEEQEHRTDTRKKRGIAELHWYRRERNKRRPVSHRRLSRDIAKDQDVRRSQGKVRYRVPTRYKEEPVDEEEHSERERNRQLRRRLIARSHAHRYSTRSTVPRPRALSVAEDNYEQSIDVDVEELSLSDAGETSADSSSGEDFSIEAKILRRSRRNEQNNHRKENRRKNTSNRSLIVNGLRRSQRQRRIPVRLKNSDGQDSSSQESEDGDVVSNSTTPFIAPMTRQNRRFETVPKRRKTRKQRISSNASSNVESSDAESKSVESSNLPTTSSSWKDAEVQLNGNATTSKFEIRTTTIKIENVGVTAYVAPGQPPLECYLPPDWIRRTTPCSFPYVPQIDDEIVYLRQGHEMYVTKVVEHHVWSIGNSELCYVKYPDIGVAEPCQVMDIEYKVGPPTLCEVQLRRINQKLSKKSSFTVCYHDMPNVVDFLILKDKFDSSISKTWSQGDSFRSIIDDSWWYGTVIDKKPIDQRYPDSHFQEVHVLWDGDGGQADYDFLSPWDMEPLSTVVMTRSQNNCKGHLRGDPQDLLDAVGYRIKVTDWGSHYDSDAEEDDYAGDSLKKKMSGECKRIAKGIKRLMRDEEFYDFAKPVDLVKYPAYPLYIAFPTDLSTIWKRVENYYYRRSSAICWEAAQLEKNALSFNQPDSIIAKKAKALHQILDSFVKDSTCSNIYDLHSQQEDDADPTYTDDDFEDRGKVRSPEVEVDSDLEEEVPGGYEQDSRDVSEYATTAEEDETTTDPTWVEECKILLADVMQAQDSRPFRRRQQKDEDGVTSDDDSDVMDLTMIEGKLLNSQYKNPEHLQSDVQDMFTSFKNSNPSREGRSMLARLSPLMKSRVEKIVSAWKKTQVVKTSIVTRRSSRRKGMPSSRIEYSDTSYDSISVMQTARISAYATRSMLKRAKHKEQHPHQQSHQPIQKREIHSNLGNIKEECDGDYEMSQAIAHTEYEITKSTTAKRRLSESDGGQGDASLSLRLRKKPRKVSEADDDSASSGDDGVRGNTIKTRRFSKNNGAAECSARLPTLPKHHKHALRVTRNRPTWCEDYSDIESNSNDECDNRGGKYTAQPTRKSARSRKPVRKYVDSDSENEVCKEIVKQEPCPSSPEDYLVPKKSARFRNGTFVKESTRTDHSKDGLNLRKTRHKQRASSHSNFSDSDDR